MKRKVYLSFILLVSMIMLCCISCKKEDTDSVVNVTEDGVREVTISLQTSANSLPFYVAQQEGFFEEAGISPQFIVYTNGPAQMEALATDAWMMGTGGISPAISGIMLMDLKIVGTCHSDDLMVDIFVRPDSPIAKSGPGHVPEYPTLYGTPDDWRGINVLGPSGTTGHYALVSALKALGLSEKDITLTNMQVPAANTAFKAGAGDAVIQWLALSVDAENQGWVKAATCHNVGADNPSIIYASGKAVEEHPDLVQEILDIYYKTTAWMSQSENFDKSVDYFYEFLNDNGVANTREECEKVLATIPYHTVAESKAYMDTSNGQSKLSKCFEDTMAFFVSEGTYTQEEADALMSKDALLDTFIMNVPE